MAYLILSRIHVWLNALKSIFDDAQESIIQQKPYLMCATYKYTIYSYIHIYIYICIWILTNVCLCFKLQLFNAHSDKRWCSINKLQKRVYWFCVIFGFVSLRTVLRLATSSIAARSWLSCYKLYYKLTPFRAWHLRICKIIYSFNLSQYYAVVYARFCSSLFCLLFAWLTRKFVLHTQRDRQMDRQLNINTYIHTYI